MPALEFSSAVNTTAHLSVMGIPALSENSSKAGEVDLPSLGLAHTHRTPWKELASKLVMEGPLSAGAICVRPSLITLNMNKNRINVTRISYFT